MKFFLLAQRGIFESAFTGGKRAAMGTVDKPVRMENFEILANRDLRGFKSAGEFGDENATLAGKQIENGTATFFVQHEISLLAARRAEVCTRDGVLFRISFYSVLFRLSTGKTSELTIHCWAD